MPRMVLLRTGNALTAAGRGRQNRRSFALARAELWNLSNGFWASTRSPINTRYYHTATLLNNGQVLAAGGDTFAATLSSAELYQP